PSPAAVYRPPACPRRGPAAVRLRLEFRPTRRPGAGIWDPEPGCIQRIRAARRRRGSRPAGSASPPARSPAQRKREGFRLSRCQLAQPDLMKFICRKVPGLPITQAGYALSSTYSSVARPRPATQPRPPCASAFGPLRIAMMNPPVSYHGSDRRVSDGAAEDPRPRSAITLRAGKLGLLSLTCVIYLIVSGGPYGTEDAVRIAGPRLTLLLCLLVPLTLSIPTALMAAELNSLMPVEGGFYFWVKAALGDFWGFAEAYLTLLYTAVDMAIYPVLFSSYLAYLCPLGPAGQIAVGVALVWISGLLNYFGVRPTGDSAVLLTGVLLAPFAALVILGFGHLMHWQVPGGRIFGPDFSVALGGGLTVI